MKLKSIGRIDLNKRIEDAIGAEVVATNEKYKGMTAKYLAELRHRLRRLASGKCLRNGCDSSGPGYCPSCRAKQAAYRRGLRMRKKSKSTKEIVG